MTQTSLVEPFLKNTYSENYLYSVNRNTFKNRHSSEVFTKHFQQGLLGQSIFYIILGCDSGLLISYLLEKGIPENTRYLFIELNELGNKITEQLPQLTDYTGQVQIANSNNWLSIAQEMNIDAYIFKQRVIYKKSLGATDLFNNNYFLLNQSIESEFQEYSFRLLSSIGNFEFIDNQLKNVSENIIPAQKLKNALPEKIAIVLAGGPSLDENLHWIIKNQHNLVIFAVSRISNRLLQVGLTPDIVISVDPKYNSFEVSRELLLLPKSVLFAHTVNVSPLLASQWYGNAVYIGDLLPWKSKLNIGNFNGEGPTVTNTAISLAYFMGIKTILLAGVDLCYSRNGHSHASGNIETDVTGTDLAFIGKPVVTYAGEQTQTTIQMALAAKMLDIQAKECLAEGVTMINLSANATASKYIEHHPTAHLEFTEEKGDIQQILNNLISQPSNEVKKQHNQLVLREVQSIISQSQKIAELSQQALKHNECLFAENKNDEEKYFHKTKIDRIEKKLNHEFKTSSSFIKEFNIQLFLDCVPTSNSDNWDDETLLKTGNLYYQAYLKGSEIVIEHLTKMRDRIISRIAELTPNADLVAIVRQWESDNQPGRCYIIEQHQQKHFSKWDIKNRKLLNKVQEEYQKLITCKTQIKKALEKQSPLQGIHTKIKLLFNQKDFVNLHALTENLLALAEKNDEAAPLYYLAQGYLLSLDEQYEQALHAFEDVEEQYLKEDEFKQIASIALKLKQTELAESALSMLVNFSDMYLPLYANFLKVTGKTKAAIDAYSQYLSSYNNDIISWLELGRLFFNINAFDSAKLAFTNALTLEANNTIAQEYLNKISTINKDN